MRIRLVAVMALALAATACTSSEEPSAQPSTSPTNDTSEQPTGMPGLDVSVMTDGLDHPWEIRSIGSDEFLITERNWPSLTLATSDGDTREIPLEGESLWVSGETGLMGLEIDPDFDTNRRVYTCSGWSEGGEFDVRINAWTLDDDLTTATHDATLLTGMPTTSGRHGGCRLLMASDGSLYAGTGDAAVGTNPQDLTSLGGKVLRLDPRTGDPWPDNPWADASDENRRYVDSYGHRNVQGLAERANGDIWTVEHGPDRDDEVNRNVSGGNYGWNPVPGYNESVPMTDHDLPGEQIDAAWSSGDPTLATSGATFLPGDGWGALNGALAVAAQKAERLLFFTLEGNALGEVRAPDVLQENGRMRTATVAPNGDLLVTTDNGNESDLVLRVRPS